jgi:antitoxin component YwqK of YwqJK toxin-antitoxin module
MKAKIIFILLVVVSNFAFSQDKIIYLDSLYREVSETNYQIKRVIKDFEKELNEHKFFEYNKDNKLLSEGTCAEKNIFKKIGTYTSYYLNGNKKQSTNYSEFMPIGLHQEWYENGNKKLEGEYLNNISKFVGNYKINQFWDENNVQKVVDGNGFFYEKNEKSVTEGVIKNGYKDGEWKENHTDSYQILEIYSEGKFISGVNTDSDGIVVNYTEMEQKPEPFDGITHFYKYIGSNFNYTKASKLHKIKGRIVLSFIVEKDGTLAEIRVVKGLGFGLDEEAVRVV